MKTIHTILLSVLLAAALPLVSCQRDAIDTEYDQGQQVTILFSADGTTSSRALTEENSAADKTINSFRVMLFRADNGNSVPVDAFTTPLDNPEKIELKTGKYYFVFIANEHSDPALTAKLNAVTNISGLKNVTIGSAAFSTSKDIPAVAIFQNVKVYGQNKVIVPAQNGNPEQRIDGVWSVMIERTGVRADIEITLSDTQTHTGNLTVANVPDKMWLWPGKYNDGSYESSARSFAPTVTNSGKTLTWKRIILPESMFEDTDDASKGAEIALTVNGVSSKARIGRNVSVPDYTMPRNTYLGIEGTVTNSGLSLFIESTPWDVSSVDGDVNGYIRRLTVSAREVELTYKTVATAYSQIVYFWSDYPTVYVEKLGYKGETGTATTFEVNKIFDKLSGDIDGNGLNIAAVKNFHYDYDGEVGTGYIELVPILESGINRGRIVLNAGGVRKEILTTASAYGLVGFTNSSFAYNSTQCYAGTFHRWNETGERLIRVPAAGQTTSKNTDQWHGVWTAFVGEENNGRDWITLDKRVSGAGERYWESPGTVIESSRAYQPKNDGTWTLSGTASDDSPLYFRVGLKSTLPGKDSDPRYGVIYLLFKNGERIWRILVRQGEKADYLMCPEDSNTTGTITTEWGGTATTPRPCAKKFQVFNLTSPAYKVGSMQESELIGYRRGVFTDFPSQGGAFFHWANHKSLTETEIYAYNPVAPATAPENFGESHSENPTIYWDDLKGTYEKCPEGYRLPTCGITTAAVEGSNAKPNDSEFKQSLFLEPKNGSGRSEDNSVFGYYADGFFDRRPVESKTEGYPTTVAKSSPTAAYKGVVFFNPKTLASVFFCSPGYRTGASNVYGELTSVGNGSSYMSATTSYTTRRYIWALDIGNSVSEFDPAMEKNGAASIRCIVDDGVTP